MRAAFAFIRGADPAALPANFCRLNRRGSALLAPIWKVFQDDLRPLLDHLPTRAQRKAATALRPE